MMRVEWNLDLGAMSWGLSYSGLQAKTCISLRGCRRKQKVVQDDVPDQGSVGKKRAVALSLPDSLGSPPGRIMLGVDVPVKALGTEKSCLRHLSFALILEPDGTSVGSMAKEVFRA
jgi:hypothetical protein